MTLLSVLPVPLMFAAPVRTRFSVKTVSVSLMLERTVSVPPPTASITTSPTLSVM